MARNKSKRSSAVEEKPITTAATDQNPFTDSAASTDAARVVTSQMTEHLDSNTAHPKSSKKRRASALQSGTYRPSFSVDARGNVHSHDRVLNSSPEALLRFIDEHAMPTRPLHARVRGTTRKVDLAGKAQLEEDFNITISIEADVKTGPGQARKPLVYTIGDWETVKGDRGSTWRNDTGAIRLPEDCEQGADVWAQIRDGSARVAINSYQAAANAITNAKLARERADRIAHGSPAFVHPGSLHDVREVHDAYSHRPVLLKDQFLDSDDIHLASSPALWQGVYTEAHRERSRTAEDVRAVVEEYCASKHGCKQLVISREYYGWDWTALKAGIEASIQANLYAGQVYVEFDNEPTTITVRAPGWSSRMLATSWGYKVPLSLVLIYPSVLLAACTAPYVTKLRIAVPLARWLIAPSHITDEAAAREFSKEVGPTRKPKVHRVQDRWAVIVGTQEGEWLKKWEKPLAVAVMERMKGGVTLLESDGARHGGARAVLRGYVSE